MFRNNLSGLSSDGKKKFDEVCVHLNGVLNGMGIRFLDGEEDQILIDLWMDTFPHKLDAKGNKIPKVIREKSIETQPVYDAGGNVVGGKNVEVYKERTVWELDFERSLIESTSVGIYKWRGEQLLLNAIKKLYNDNRVRAVEKKFCEVTKKPYFEPKKAFVQASDGKGGKRVWTEKDRGKRGFKEELIGQPYMVSVAVYLAKDGVTEINRGDFGAVLRADSSTQGMKLEDGRVLEAKVAGRDISLQVTESDLVRPDGEAMTLDDIGVCDSSAQGDFDQTLLMIALRGELSELEMKLVGKLLDGESINQLYKADRTLTVKTMNNLKVKVARVLGREDLAVRVLA